MTITVTNNPILLDILAIAGDTLDNWSIKFADSDGVAYDISTFDFYFVVKKSYKTADSEAVVSKAPADAVKSDSGSGVVDTLSFPLTPAETEFAPGKYVHAIKLLDGTDERTWVEGLFTLTQRRIDTI